MYYDIINAEKSKKFETVAKELGVRIILSKELKIVEGVNDEKTRKALENKRTDILLNPQQGREKDFMHSRNSGLNQVLCKLANKNKIAIGISLDKLYETKELGKTMQNIRLCRKHKVNIIFLSMAKLPYELRSPKDLMSLGKVLGMATKEAKDSVSYLGEILKSKAI